MQGKGNSLLILMGLKMKPKMKLTVLKCLMFFDDQLLELIVCETNTYAAQKIQARSFIPLRSRMWDWKPVTKDEMMLC